MIYEYIDKHESNVISNTVKFVYTLFYKTS